MNVEINGETRSLSVNTSLQQLVAELGLENKRLAIEINSEIVPRSEYPKYLIQDADKIEIVQAIGGG